MQTCSSKPICLKPTIPTFINPLWNEHLPSQVTNQWLLYTHQIRKKILIVQSRRDLTYLNALHSLILLLQGLDTSNNSNQVLISKPIRGWIRQHSLLKLQQSRFNLTNQVEMMINSQMILMDLQDPCQMRGKRSTLLQDQLDTNQRREVKSKYWLK